MGQPNEASEGVNSRNPSQGGDGDLPSGPPFVAFYPWLLVAIGAVMSVVHGTFRPAWAAGGGLAAFAVLYMAAIWLRMRAHRQRAAVACLIAAAALTIALTIGYGGDMFSLFPLLSIVCGVVVPWTERRPPLPAVIVTAVACTGVIIAWAHHAASGDIWSVAYGSFLAGFIVATFLRLVAVIRQLQETRQELARAAVSEERLRFARDLHDLLGHTLSVMVVKAQLVRKMALRDPEQAAEQAADIETVGRQALAEVRESVSGYRGRGVARELAEAQAALADADFTVAIRQDDVPLTPAADALLGWVIREGVTNVIRHSGGHQAEIEVGHRHGQAFAEIRDDGGGSPAVQLPSGGNGLGGLRERAAAAGGTVEAGPRRGGGYRLCVRIPASRREEITA
jgi:two-component system, NarL family, sensor histidine kinase DesK